MLEILIDQITEICMRQKDKRIKEKLHKLLIQYDIKKINNGETHPDILEKMNMFLMVKKMEGLSPKTLQNYRKTIQNFGAYTEKPISKITTEDIRNWLLSCRDLKMSTIRYYISVMKTFFEYLITDEIVIVDPTRKIKLPKLEQRIPKALNVDELEILRDGCKTLREKALLETFYASGWRLAEIHRLNRSDIDWQERCFPVIGKGNKERVAFIGARAAHAIRKYLDSRNDTEKALFVTEKGIPRRLSERTIHAVFKKIAMRVAVHKNIHPHVFRQTLATSMVNHGAKLEDVQAILGHSSPNTTQVYAQVSLERKKQAYNQHFVN